MPRPTAAASDTVDPAEIRRFAALAEEWWAPAGKFRPLHALNPVRLGFIRGQALAAFGRAPGSGRRSPGLTYSIRLRRGLAIGADAPARSSRGWP
jgi:2-polyprenyl-6-hydroxyphenyl methylase/3-demethylubiquinone-9 3-methyltransferase